MSMLSGFLFNIIQLKILYKNESIAFDKHMTYFHCVQFRCTSPGSPMEILEEHHNLRQLIIYLTKKETSSVFKCSCRVKKRKKN